jgi:predicted RNase H-like HicB family nuclease
MVGWRLAPPFLLTLNILVFGRDKGYTKIVKRQTAHKRRKVECHLFTAEEIMRYKVVLEESDEGFSVSVPGLPGCHSQGATEQEALENVVDAIAEYLEVVAELSRDKITREVEV